MTKFLKNLPRSFREGHGGDLACQHRDVSVCDECVAKYANIVEVGGQHFWTYSIEERDELVALIASH